jgi:choline dehydrogenase-like flavoprotein
VSGVIFGGDENDVTEVLRDLDDARQRGDAWRVKYDEDTPVVDAACVLADAIDRLSRPFPIRATADEIQAHDDAERALVVAVAAYRQRATA